MRLDELFARNTRTAVWTKSGRTLACDDGVEGLRPRDLRNVLKVKRNA